MPHGGFLCGRFSRTGLWVSGCLSRYRSAAEHLRYIGRLSFFGGLSSFHVQVGGWQMSFGVPGTHRP